MQPESTKSQGVMSSECRKHAQGSSEMYYLLSGQVHRHIIQETVAKGTLARRHRQGRTVGTWDQDTRHADLLESGTYSACAAASSGFLANE